MLLEVVRAEGIGGFDELSFRFVLSELPCEDDHRSHKLRCARDEHYACAGELKEGFGV